MPGVLRRRAQRSLDSQCATCQKLPPIHDQPHQLRPDYSGTGGGPGNPHIPRSSILFRGHRTRPALTPRASHDGIVVRNASLQLRADDLKCKPLGERLGGCWIIPDDRRRLALPGRHATLFEHAFEPRWNGDDQRPCSAGLDLERVRNAAWPPDERSRSSDKILRSLSKPNSAFEDVKSFILSAVDVERW